MLSDFFNPSLYGQGGLNRHLIQDVNNFGAQATGLNDKGQEIPADTKINQSRQDEFLDSRAHQHQQHNEFFRQQQELKALYAPRR